MLLLLLNVILLIGGEPQLAYAHISVPPSNCDQVPLGIEEGASFALCPLPSLNPEIITKSPGIAGFQPPLTLLIVQVVPPLQSKEAVCTSVAAALAACPGAKTPAAKARAKNARRTRAFAGQNCLDLVQGIPPKAGTWNSKLEVTQKPGKRRAETTAAKGRPQPNRILYI
jgi:hypothetical protein